MLPYDAAQLSEYADLLGERGELEARLAEVQDELKQSEDGALGILRQVGVVVVPVDRGEWALRADRDEDGPFIDASFRPASHGGSD